MEHCTKNIKSLLPHGSISAIARSLGISTPAVSKALKQGRPGNRVVQEAVRIAEASGALHTARALAGLTLNPNVALAEVGGLELAQEVTRLSKARIYALVSAREIPHRKRGNKLHFNRTELLAWVNAGKRG
uniref:Helix-turn-helix domain-containing protein n=1 Tax=Tanacetum cinerariifolium TaxID=118510 RepID=A0A699J913_TANCI|nr:hypothetical protein [Tanacetum cinerariifolium]